MLIDLNALIGKLYTDCSLHKGVEGVARESGEDAGLTSSGLTNQDDYSRYEQNGSIKRVQMHTFVQKIVVILTVHGLEGKRERMD